MHCFEDDVPEVFRNLHGIAESQMPFQMISRIFSWFL